MRRILPAFFLIFIAFGTVVGQHEILLRGAVYDSSRMIAIPMVKVSSTGGSVAYTDSIGHYNILVSKNDSVSFNFRGKSTTLFPVRDIKYQQGFDISLQVNVADRYKTLKEVVVIAKSYKQDSLENREKYRKVFEFENGLSINSGGGMGGGAGLDPNSLINMFRFRRNKSLRTLQSRLMAEEAEKFVNYRFNKTLVKHLSSLEGTELDRFMNIYRPSYDFAASATEYQFAQYILDASRMYKRGIIPPPEFWRDN